MTPLNARLRQLALNLYDRDEPLTVFLLGVLAGIVLTLVTMIILFEVSA
jgi:hypothetical protein